MEEGYDGGIPLHRACSYSDKGTDCVSLLLKHASPIGESQLVWLCLVIDSQLGYLVCTMTPYMCALNLYSAGKLTIKFPDTSCSYKMMFIVIIKKK